MSHDNEHRTPLRWPPRVGRRQLKPRAGAQVGDQPSDRQPERDQPSAAKLPHERDESTTSSDPPSVKSRLRKLIGRAHDDLAAGRVDTDLRGDAPQIIERARRRARGER